MRAPPAVSLVARPGRGWRVAQALLHAAVALALTVWAAAWLEAATWRTPAAMVATVAAGWIGWRLSAAPPVRLVWSGTAWSMAPGAGAPVVIAPPQVMLDLGRWMLLRGRPEAGGPAAWLAVGAADAGPAWHLFRAAVYSSAPVSQSRSAEERPPP